MPDPATKSLEMKDTTSLVGAYYSGKSVLVTGATGFMGKVLVEKLLRSCHDVKTIYVCVRPKGGRSMQTRVEHLLKCKVFDRVREESPCFHEKVKPISAEFTKPGLAISSEDREELISEVNLLETQKDWFGPAPTPAGPHPSFCASLSRNALLLNVLGTQQLLRLAHQMKNLEALIHVSTAYSNCNRRHIEEVFYPIPVEPKKLLDMMAWMDESLIEAITPNLIADWPNTYTFSKALTEHLIQQEKGDLNVAIIRPSIVGASWQEPFPGWVDNFNGISGFLVAAQIANDLQLYLWKPQSIVLGRIGTREINAIRIYEKNPLEKPFRIPNARMTSSYLLHQYWTFACHTIPAFLGDLYLRLMGKKPWMMKLFCFDVCQLTWPEYMKDYCLGTKKYLLNEDMAGIPATQQYIRKLKTIQWALKATLLVILWRVFIAKSQMARNIWYFVLSLCYKFLSYLRASSTLTH
ncbi:hypothetical protein Chor_002549 [Crotalus horridus]